MSVLLADFEQVFAHWENKILNLFKVSKTRTTILHLKDLKHYYVTCVLVYSNLDFDMFVLARIVADMYLEPSQTSKMESFTKIVNS